ncbi:MAG: hypothetical protein HC908_18855 [Calothrix sp. SM1_7_51]|nr:hypothetical protein [Calothrix sp. SM1_7_51]
MLLEREDNLIVIPATQDLEIGDRLIYLLHDPKPTLLKRLSGARHIKSLSLEALPEIEELPLTVRGIRD